MERKKKRSARGRRRVSSKSAGKEETTSKIKKCRFNCGEGRGDQKGIKMKDPMRQRHSKGVSCYQIFPGTGHFPHNDKGWQTGQGGARL